MPRIVPFPLLALLLVAFPMAARAACEAPVPESEWSLVKPLATESLMLDIAQVGATFVAVGDRGHVLISEDDGRNWTQKRTPTRSLLTGVWFHDRNLGWAVGHDAVILRTEDGGETWCRVHWAPEFETPLLDVWFADESNGFAIGAYGYFLRSADGGLSWQEEELDFVEYGDVADPDADQDADDEYADDDDAGWDDGELGGIAGDLHLNRIIPGNGEVFLAAEAGTIFRSDDGGFTWIALDPSYEGSFFGGVRLADDSLLVFGLRGNMFRSWDGGENWRGITLPVDTSLFGGARLADGGVAVVGTAGVMLISREGDRFRLEQRPDRMALVGAVATTDGALIVIGEPGIERIEQHRTGRD
ncbi:MAG: WD40/YVTN/BNR-like repeat-containing protein [Gammaproteobacteria bacterium]